MQPLAIKKSSLIKKKEQGLTKEMRNRMKHQFKRRIELFNIDEKKSKE
tara:strand:+ start:331 stop:474 length:144 start_codon:yes stop_codon:yes gene_type:complete